MDRLRAPEKLCFTGNVSENWRKFKQEFGYYTVATEMDEKPDKVRISFLLHIAGEEAIELYNTFVYAQDEDKNDFLVVLEKI